MFNKNNGSNEHDILQNQFTSFLSKAISNARIDFIRAKIARLQHEQATDQIELLLARETFEIEIFMENEALKQAIKDIREKERYVFLARALDGKKFKEIAKELGMTVRRWQTELINSPKKYKPTYLRTLNSQLSAIFNFAVKYYGLPYNPVQRSGPMGKKKSDLMQFWKPDEFQKFIEAVSDKLMSKVIFNLLYWSGMRSGELLALTLNDFDFEERTVSINKNFARVDGEDLILEPKTPKSKRKITLPQFVCDMVKDYADKLYGYDPSERLFEITKHYLKSEMERGCKKTGVRLIRVHDIRHSHASLLIEMGFTPLLISERLGHESAVITLGTYAHLYPDKQNEVAARLEAFA